MSVRVAVQRASWDVMHHKLVTPGFLDWFERCCPGIRAAAVSDEDIMERALDYFDAVFFPGSIGSALAVQKYGPIYRAAVRDFVRRGGCFIGVCGGCYAAVREFRLRKVTRTATSGAVKNLKPIRSTIKEFTEFEKGIGRKAGRAAGPGVMSALLRGRLKTFDLVNATATAPRFFGDPDFIKERWSRLVIDGNLLQVRLRVSDSPNPLIEGHRGEALTCAYSGGPILEEVGYGVDILATYDKCETLPEAGGKAAIAFSKHGDGLVIVSGPDFYIPFEAEPGVVIHGEMAPSVPWLMTSIVSDHRACRRSAGFSSGT